MATLEKIRGKAGLLVIVVGLALFAFIIGDFLNSGSTYFRQTQERIASVDGEVINIQDYQARIDEMSEVYKMQTGNSNVSEEIMSQIRQSVFDTMVQEIVLGTAAETLGLSVSSEELFDMVQGENISPIIQQMPMFLNEAGVFDKTALLNFLKAIDDDNIANYPAEQQMQMLQMRQFWLFWEKSIKQQRLEEKYTNLLTKAISANSLDAKDNFNGSAQSADIAYAMQAFSSIPDSVVTVTKGEVEKLYNQRKETYKQEESRVVDYVAVDIVPSSEDFEKAQTEIEALRSELQEATNVADLVNENSDIPYTNAFFSESAFDAETKQFVTSAEIGAVEGPVFADNTYRVFKLIDKTVAPDSVMVSHIMLAGGNEAQVAALTDSLMGVLKTNPASFEEVARDNSVDQSAANGGELGWFTEAAALRGVNEDFKIAIFTAAVNELKVVKSMYGTHIVKVTEKTSPVNKYKIANLVMGVTPSSKTYSSLYNDLNSFISTNNTVASLEENAREAGYNILTDVTVAKNDNVLGSIRSARQVIRWAFQNEKGKISDIFEADDKFIVAAVKGSIPEGYQPLSSVSPVLQMELRSQKKGEMIVNDLKAKNLTSLDAYATAMNGRVDSVKFVTFNTSRISGIGQEPKLNGLLSLAEVGKLTGPVAGRGGVYVFEVANKNQENNEYDETMQLNTLNAANAYRFGFQAIQSLVNKSKVEDNRFRFY